jgi:signal transduction histidine kinase
VKPAHVWSVFGLSVAALLAALAWSSASVLRLERAELQARAQASLEENTRLALWRLDSSLMPLLAQESARTPAPDDPPAPVLLRFEVAPGGVVTAPPLPRAADHLQALRVALAGADLAARLPKEPAAPPASAALPASDPAASQSVKNVVEYVARQQAFQKVNSSVLPPRMPPPRPVATREGQLTALWVGDSLLLARRVGTSGAVYVQGSWLDWPSLRRDLLASVQDLLPGARLEPTTAAARPDEERRLATLPVRLVPGAVAVAASPGLSPARLSLAGVWACALLAAVAVGALLRGVMDLSERRRVFVSAVTHELRTPLTTFRLYTDMLAEGMVPDEGKRREYVARLQSEAERLGHLVENVLFYARVETGRGAAARETVDLRPVLEEMRPRLAERAGRAGIELAWEMGVDRPLTVRVDRSAVDQILLNLVDNACKYAAAATPARIEVALESSDGRARIRVRDHGPGLSAAGRRRLFQPFSTSDREAANSAPGIGLGLALSRRLARAQGGELSLESSGPEGAAFVLSLPAPDAEPGAPRGGQDA